MAPVEAARRTKGLPGPHLFPAATQKQSTSACFNQSCAHMAPIASDGKGTLAVVREAGCVMCPATSRSAEAATCPQKLSACPCSTAHPVLGAFCSISSAHCFSLGSLMCSRQPCRRNVWISELSIALALPPRVQQPLTHCKGLCFSVFFNLCTCSPVTHLLHHLKQGAWRREIAPSTDLAFQRH